MLWGRLAVRPDASLHGQRQISAVGGGPVDSSRRLLHVVLDGRGVALPRRVGVLPRVAEGAPAPTSSAGNSRARRLLRGNQCQ